MTLTKTFLKCKYNLKNANKEPFSLVRPIIDCTFALAFTNIVYHVHRSRMKRKHLFLPLCMVATSWLLTSCASYRVEGSTSVPTLNGQKLYLKISDQNNIIDLDSCEVIHGNFRMDGEVDSTALGSLYLAGESLMPIVIERGRIKISIENSGLRVSGTPLNETLYGFIHEKNLLEQRLMDVQHKQMQLIMEGTPAEEAEQMASQEQDTLAEEMNQLIIKFVTENFDNLLSVQIFKIYCLAFTEPTITPTIQTILDKAPTDFKENEFVKEYLRLAEKEK